MSSLVRKRLRMSGRLSGYLLSRHLVGDGQPPVVGRIVVIEDARGHEVGMSYLAQFLHLIAIGIKGRRAVVGVPCGMGRVHHPVGLVERVVPQDVCVAVGDAQVVVVDVHLCRVVSSHAG